MWFLQDKNTQSPHKYNMMLLWGSLALIGIYLITWTKKKQRRALPSNHGGLARIPLKHFVRKQASQADNHNYNAAQWESFQQQVSKRGIVCVVLAAGEGSRFKASVPKVIYPFNGKPLALYALEAAQKVADGAIPTIFVVGYEKELVTRTLGNSLNYVVQDTRMGTGHAVYLVKNALPKDYSGDVIVTCADNPGVDSSLLDRLIDCHHRYKQQLGKKYAALILTGKISNTAHSYGRIIRDKQDNVVDIVEKKQLDRMEQDSLKYCGNEAWSKQQLYQVDEFNSGIVIACSKPYFEALGNIEATLTTSQHPPKYEYYATDFVSQLTKKGYRVRAFLVPEQETWKLEGANTVEELDKLGTKFWTFKS